MGKSPIPSRNRKVAAQKDEILGRESESRVVSVSGWLAGTVGTDWRGHLLSKQVDSFLTERLVLAGVLIRFPPTTTTMSADQGGGVGLAGSQTQPPTTLETQQTSGWQFVLGQRGDWNEKDRI